MRKDKLRDLNALRGGAELESSLEDVGNVVVAPSPERWQQGEKKFRLRLVGAQQSSTRRDDLSRESRPGAAKHIGDAPMERSITEEGQLVGQVVVDSAVQSFKGSVLRELEV